MYTTNKVYIAFSCGNYKTDKKKSDKSQTNGEIFYVHGLESPILLRFQFSQFNL